MLKAVGGGTFAAGLASASAAETASTVVVDGAGAGSGVAYCLLMTGEVTGKSTASGASVNGNDAAAAAGAWGYVSGGRDAYEFTGELVGFWSAGDPAVLVDGDAANPPAASAVRLASEGSGSAEYDLSVTGVIAKAPGGGASIDDSDALSVGSVSGRVAGGEDRYAYTGEISGVDATGDLAVYVDGEKRGYDGAWPPESGRSGGDPRSARIEAAIHDEMNARRADRDLDPLPTKATLDAAARAHSRDMVERGFFAHTAPGDDSFSDHYRDEGVTCRGLGENILMRSVRADRPDEIAANAVDRWMASRSHRGNVLREAWRGDGVGVAFDGDGSLYATQGFGFGFE